MNSSDSFQTDSFQTERTNAKINRINDKETTFDDFIKKYKDLNIKNPKILEAVFNKWSKRVSFNVSEPPMLTHYSRYISTPRGKELFDLFSSKLTNLDKIKAFYGPHTHFGRTDWLDGLGDLDNLIETEKKRLLKEDSNNSFDDAYQLMKIVYEHPFTIIGLKYLRNEVDDFKVVYWAKPFFEKYGQEISLKTKRLYSDMKKNFFDVGLSVFVHHNNHSLEKRYNEWEYQFNLSNIANQQKETWENDDYEAWIKNNYDVVIKGIRDFSEGMISGSFDLGNYYNNELIDTGIDNVHEVYSPDNDSLLGSYGNLFQARYKLPQSYNDRYEISSDLYIRLYPNYAIITCEPGNNNNKMKGGTINTVRSIEEILGQDQCFIGTRKEVLEKKQMIEKL